MDTVTASDPPTLADLRLLHRRGALECGAGRGVHRDGRYRGGAARALPWRHPGHHVLDGSRMGLGRFVGGLLPLGNNRYMGMALHRRPGDEGIFSARALDRLNGSLPQVLL
ncbi:hypothetical protein MASR1M6_36090 [Rubrivivax sp.]